MPLTEFNKGQIVAYRDCGLTYADISAKIAQPVSTIADFYSGYQKKTEESTANREVAVKEKQQN